MKKEEALLNLITNIKDYIEGQEMTVYQLARRTKIHDNMIHALLKNERKDIKLSSICIYAEAMGVLPADLLTPNYFVKK